MASTARLLTNAVVLTPAPTAHDSVAIVDGNIVAIGKRADAEAALPTEHEVTDVEAAPSHPVSSMLTPTHSPCASSSTTRTSAHAHR